jgi:hypothetical protein
LPITSATFCASAGPASAAATAMSDRRNIVHLLNRLPRA